MTRLTGPMLHASLAAFKISVKEVMLGGEREHHSLIECPLKTARQGETS
jgi:hypothetical protein